MVFDGVFCQFCHLGKKVIKRSVKVGILQKIGNIQRISHTIHIFEVLNDYILPQMFNVLMNFHERHKKGTI